LQGYQLKTDNKRWGFDLFGLITQGGADFVSLALGYFLSGFQALSV